jgi:hypothetical protein
VLEKALEALSNEFRAMMAKVDEEDRANFRRILLAVLQPDN